MYMLANGKDPGIIDVISTCTTKEFLGVTNTYTCISYFALFFCRLHVHANKDLHKVYIHVL